jgi:hypothetical protein
VCGGGRQVDRNVGGKRVEHQPLATYIGSEFKRPAAEGYEFRVRKDPGVPKG